jgi:hypothetical protein
VNCTIVSATAVMTNDRSVPNWMSASAVGKITPKQQEHHVDHDRADAGDNAHQAVRRIADHAGEAPSLEKAMHGC